MADESGNKLAARRQFGHFPDPPFMIVPRISHLDAIAARFDAQDEIDDILGRNVGGVRRVKAAPADVVADALFRQSGERMIERLDGHRRPLAIWLRLGGGKSHPEK